ncbi:MAG: thioredoxin domain-containing protein [Hyphomicrobiaceae bacterium]
MDTAKSLGLMAAIAVAVLLGACSNEQGQTAVIGAATAESASADVSGLAAYPTTATAPPKQTFGRAGDAAVPDSASTGGRKIIAEPTAADLAVAGPLGDRFLGSPHAPLTVYEFASMTCPHCRAFHASSFPAIKKAYIDTGKIKWVIREFPIGRSSGNAWIITRCAPDDTWHAVYERLLAEQASWVSQEVRLDAIFAVAAKEGMSRAAFDSCLANQPLIDGLNWVKERGRELGVIGTPTFFIGTKHVRQVLTPDEFKAIVEPMLSGGVVASSG